ncbi:MAG TPA: hypothetical protein VJB15_05330 [Rhodothermia bacterium]|nr:hypothetical protein [Rhodothermia bacterium]
MGRISITGLLAAAMFALSVTPAAGQITTSETFYVSMLGTRMHRLSGVNPTVGLFYTRDGGNTWQHTGWEQGKAFAAVTPHGGRGDTIFIAAGNGVMITKDGGAEWRIATGWDVTEVQDVAVSKGRRSDLFAATPYGIYRSTDFGGSWERVADSLAQPFVASIRVDRNDPDRILAGTEGGLYASSDSGDTWQPGELRQPVRSVRQSPLEPYVWAAALQDQGVAISYDRGATWANAGGLAGKTIYEVEFDPINPQRLLAGGWKTGILESMDEGAHWKRIDDDLPAEDVHGIAFSRGTDGLVIAGTMNDGVFISRDGGIHWTPADPEIFAQGQIWDVYVEGEQ